MPTEYSMDDKVYAVSDDRKLSMTDMLEYFAQHGSLRVSGHFSGNGP